MSAIGCYSVVEFEDSSISTVPTNWIADPKSCYWPIKKKDFKVMMKKCIKPEDHAELFALAPRKVFINNSDMSVCAELAKNMSGEDSPGLDVEDPEGKITGTCTSNNKQP